MMNVAIMGFGTIGSGVYEALEANRQLIAEKVGQEIAVKYVLDLRDFPGTPVEDKIVHDFSRIVEDDDISIVVETMGGLNPAYPFVKACLEAGKHVATSNKALVAAYGTELLAIAREKQVNFMFEASVGGGIPIIRPLYRCLMGEQILEITGILNGTTNFILTKMDKEGASFNGALKEAQDLGYAERNPEADVEGHDTCRKIAILTAMATGREVNYEDIYTEGITKITDTDFKYAEKMGTSVKLFGSSRM
ncbi:MAG: homoserine dehydrogenase, partial [Hungatella hathewayi]|nr:homoserine dehydrogenase [Hungatella hathewayi]